MSQYAAGTYIVRVKLLPKLHSPDSTRRQEALTELIRMGEAAVPGLLQALQDAPPATHKHTLLALKQIGHPSALPALRDLATNSDDPLILTLAGGTVRANEEARSAARQTLMRVENLRDDINDRNGRNRQRNSDSGPGKSYYERRPDWF